MFLLFWQGGFLRLFIDNIPPNNWQDTATSWLIYSIVVSVLGTGLIFGIKSVNKSMADIARKKIWTRGKTWLLIFIGIFPIFFALLTIWWVTRDFFNYVAVGGLMKGTVFAWSIYLFLMIVGHLVSPWRRELI